MTSSDSGTWNPESFDRGLTECGTCGTCSGGIDEASLRKLVGDEIRKYLASASPDATVARSPLDEGDGSGGEGCEAQGRSEGLDVDELERLAYKRGRLHLDAALDLIVEVRRLRADAKRSSQAWDQLLGERDSAVVRGDQWKADAIDADNQRTLVQKFLNETVRERDEARADLTVAKAQAESEAVARAEAEAARDETRAELPGKIAAAIEERADQIATPPSAFDGVSLGREQGFRVAFRESAKVARSFASLAEPVPEPVREWGVRHRRGPAAGPWRQPSEAGARGAVCGSFGCHVVSRVPGGEWEAAD